MLIQLGIKPPGPHFLYCKEIIIKKKLCIIRGQALDPEVFKLTDKQLITLGQMIFTRSIVQGKRSYRKILRHLKSFALDELYSVKHRQTSPAESCHLKLFNTVFFCEKLL